MRGGQQAQTAATYWKVCHIIAKRCELLCCTVFSVCLYLLSLFFMGKFVGFFFYGLLRCNLSLYNQSMVILVKQQSSCIHYTGRSRVIELSDRLFTNLKNCLTHVFSFEVRHKPSSNEDFIEDIVKVINGRYKGLSGKQCKSMLLFIIFSIIGMTSNDHIETWRNI